MPTNDSDRAIRLEQESRAWELRQKGHTQREIAAALAIAHTTVGRMLARVEKRALARLTKRVEHQKVSSTEVLDFVRSEALRAWEKSKGTRKRVVQKTVRGAVESTVVEALDREGDVSYLDRALAADDRIRSIWGVDSPPAKPKDADGASGLTVSQIAQRIAENEAKHEADQADQEQPAD